MTTPDDTTTEEAPVDISADIAPETPAPGRSFFSAQPRYAALLPNSRFFTRIVPITEEASVTEQVDLALETNSPFPLSQLYHGFYWLPGSPHALVFAAYRKRFPAEETQLWPADEIVLPALAIALVVPAAAGTVRLSIAPDSITVLHWSDDLGVPTQAVIEPLAADLSDSDRAAARDQLLHRLGLGTSFEDWSQAELLRMNDAGDLTFSVADQEVKVPAELAAILDIRDKFEMAERTRLRRRDVWLWRTALASAALLVLCAVGQTALHFSQSGLVQRQAVLKNNEPLVNLVKDADTAVKEISQRTTHPLLPMEMLYLVGKVRPDNTLFTQAAFQTINSANAYVLQATIRTISLSETESFITALTALPEIATVTESGNAQQNSTNADGVPLWTDRLNITFKPDSVLPEKITPDAPATSTSSPPPA